MERTKPFSLSKEHVHLACVSWPYYKERVSKNVHPHKNRTEKGGVGEGSNHVTPRLLPSGLKSTVTRAGRKLHLWGGKMIVKCTTALGCANLQCGPRGAAERLSEGSLPWCFQHVRSMWAVMVSHCWAKTVPSDAAGLNHFVSLYSTDVILPATSPGSANMLWQWCCWLLLLIQPSRRCKNHTVSGARWAARLVLVL